LSTPRQIAMERMQSLGAEIDSVSKEQEKDEQYCKPWDKGVAGIAIDGGLPMLIMLLFEEAYELWSSFFKTELSHVASSLSYESTSSNAAAPMLICNSNEFAILQRTVRLLTKVTQLDPTFGEEIVRAGSSSICKRCIDQINRSSYEECVCVEDSDALVELQDDIFEIYVPSLSARSMAFTNDELKKRLPLIYNFASVSNSGDTAAVSQTAQTNIVEHENVATLATTSLAAADTTTTILINQVTKRQTAQADVGFVMWPSAIVLSRWLISNPHLLLEQNEKGSGKPYTMKSILELGAGCGLVGIATARILLAASGTKEKEFQERNKHREFQRMLRHQTKNVIITDVNDLVLENIHQNVHLNDASSVASVAKLDFYKQTGDNHSGGWISDETEGDAKRPPVDVILAADIICQPSDAVAASKTIYDALKPNGVAYAVCATAEHRFGVEIFASECDARGLQVTMRNVAEMCNGELLLEEEQQMMQTAAGYVEGMELTFFEIIKS